MKVVKAFVTMTGGVFFEAYLRPELQKSLGNVDICVFVVSFSFLLLFFFSC
jgi:hypothetical protein